MNEEENVTEIPMDEFLISDLITIIYKSYNNHLIRQIADLNITPAQIPFILELMYSKQASQDDLANKLFLSRGTTAKTLRKLDDEDMIERKVDMDNRRKYQVHLTEKGKEVATKVDEIDKDWEKMLFNHLKEFINDQDMEKIRPLLESLAKSSVESMMEEREKLRQKAEENCFDGCEEISPFGKALFGDFPFKGHFFRGIDPRMNFFGRKAPHMKREPRHREP